MVVVNGQEYFTANFYLKKTLQFPTELRAHSVHEEVPLVH